MSGSGPLILWLAAFGAAGLLVFVACARNRAAPPRPDGVRVFAAELGEWPLVFQAAPSVYRFYAPHERPADWFFSAPSDPNISVNSKSLSWVSPSGQTLEVPTRAVKKQMHVQLPHRQAGEEAREHQNTAQRHARMQEAGQRGHAARVQNHENAVRTGKMKGYMAETMRPASHIPINMPPPSPKYQIASELIIRTGSGDQIWLAVAELAEDEHGERANALHHAIDFVCERCLKEAGSGPRAEQPAAPAEPFE